MILVLCEETDVSALEAAAALEKRGLSSTVLVGETLASVSRWRHTVGGHGARISMRLQGYGELDGGDITGVLNRLSFLPQACLKRMAGPDRDYATQEMFAFYMSWLHALPAPQFNPPTPQGLCGNIRHPSAWTALAARVNLQVQPFHQSSGDDPSSFWQPRSHAGVESIFVVGDAVIGSADLVKRHGPACHRLAKAAATPLLGIDFCLDPDHGWRFTSASVVPDLARGGDPLLDALATELGR